jgi:hypothetical protein
MNTNDDKKIKIKALRKVILKHYKDYYSKLFDERIPEFKELREKNNE